jgi:GDP-L-fucose synthase
MKKDARIFVAGHTGLVGSALMRRLSADGHGSILVRTRAELDLSRQDAVEQFFERERPEYVFLAAAKVGGILANSTYPADFIRENLLIEAHVIDAARRYGVKKLLFFGSSCVYPKLAPQPIREDYLLTGPFEPTNQAYAVAKLAGLEMIRAFRAQHQFPGIAIVPAGVYGPNDDFDLASSHVLSAIMRRFHEAKVAGAPEVVLWGTGSPLREFLYVDDLADACVFLMDTYEGDDLLNVGWGEDMSIRDLAELVKSVVGYPGKLRFDTSKPDGMPRKLLDASRVRALGWQPKVKLPEGLERTYRWYLEHPPA